MRRAALWLVLLLAWVMAGCASGLKEKVNQIDWNSRIGQYTYADALAELGQPDLIGESSSGRTAEWVVQRRSEPSFGIGIGSGAIGPHTGVGVGVGSTIGGRPHGDYLQLTFDTTGQLREWSRVKY